jgi:predicted acyltransferase
MTDIKNKSDITPSVAVKNRLLSLDALRGFDMFWIAGGGSVITALAKLSGAGWLETLAKQTSHVPWIGFRFWDLIFPLFMFIAGISIPLSVKSKLEGNVPKKSLLIKAFTRMITLIILGFLYNGIFQDGFTNARYVSVLAQIGLSVFFASVIVIFSGSFKTTMYWLAGILAGITVLQLFVPVPGIGAGVLTPEGCINGYIDRLLLPGRLSYAHNGMLESGNGFYDALGLLSIISAIGMALMGTIAGNILQRVNLTGYRKAGILAITGVVLILVALIISPFYPIIKNCWSTTYNLLAGGISFVLIALFYLVIDVLKYQKWSFCFRVIGMNSIFIYLFFRIVPIGTIVGFFLGWIIKPAGDMGELITVLGILAAEWLLLYLMYRKNIFIKV